jgi:hypothetical protein
MRNFIRILFLIPVLVMVAPAHSATQINDQIPNAKIVGQGRLTYMLWDVYDAALYAPDGAWDEAKPFALRLSYLRHLKGKKIADRSIEEIRKQGFTDEIKLAAWHAQMKKIFPDVENGVSLTGVRTKAGETIFFKDDLEVGRINDPAFTTAFFNIWLSDKTSEPNLRRKLLGLL